MATLDIVIMIQCDTNNGLTQKVQGSKGNEYTVRYSPPGPGPYWQNAWSCDCPGYKYRRTCKHVEEAQKSFCGWHEQIFGGKAREYQIEETNEFTGETYKVTKWECPKCGESASPVRCGV